MSKRSDDGTTRLRITNMRKECDEPFLATGESLTNYFFYPENPLIGSLIVQDEKISFYRRTQMPCPSKWFDPDFRGILFINNFARARLDIPFVVNLKADMRASDSRKRDVFGTSKAIRKISSAAKDLCPNASYTLLCELGSIWSNTPRNYKDILTWYFFICQLVRNVATDESLSARFREAHDDLYYLERKSSDRRRNVLIENTRKWIEESGIKRTNIVNPIFRLLGAKPLTDMYEAEVLSEYKSATEHELKRADFLFAFVESLFGRNFFYETRPELYISDKSNADSLQFSERDYSKSSRRYKLGKIICRRTLLTESGFEEAVVAFVNILAESFSTKRSKKRAYVLTLLGELLISGSKWVTAARNAWRD
ncbi:MAG: hypothetical protein Q4A32_09675 [Lachnospiraceae bacterium]|nr:hypothetical protein [Lachnospiraceae bacterium]